MLDNYGFGSQTQLQFAITNNRFIRGVDYAGKVETRTTFRRT